MNDSNTPQGAGAMPPASLGSHVGWFMSGAFCGALAVGFFLSLAYAMGEDRGHDRMQEYAVLAEVGEWYKKPDGTQGFRWVRRTPQ